MLSIRTLRSEGVGRPPERPSHPRRMSRNYGSGGDPPVVVVDVVDEVVVDVDEAVADGGGAGTKNVRLPQLIGEEPLGKDADTEIV